MWCFFKFFSKCSFLFEMPKMIDVGLELSNFLSNWCLLTEMSFVDASQKLCVT